MTVRLFEVGGCIRDELLGLKSKDVDFAVEAESFGAMRDYLITEGFKIYIEKPEFLTIRAMVPEGHKLRERAKDADFVLCRKDGPTIDGRRPEFVEPGTIMDDLARRDFTINAIARDVDGQFIDPFCGVADCERRILRFVGDPRERIKEDGLRILRGLRFILTKDLDPELDTEIAIFTTDLEEALRSVSAERIREELNKMFRHDTIGTLSLLRAFDLGSLDSIFKDGLRLESTLKE